MIIFGSFDPDMEGQATEVMDSIFWGLWDQYKTLCDRAKVDRDGTEEDMENFRDKVEKEHDPVVFEVLGLLSCIKGGPGCILDQEGKEVQVEDPKQYYDEQMYMVVNGEGPLFAITTGLDEAEDLFNEVNKKMGY